MKKENQNLIVINGRTYDARSGMATNEQSAPSLKKVMSDIAPAGPRQDLPNASLVKRDASGKITTGAAVNATQLTRHHVAAKKVHRAPQKAQTLVRTAVRRPQLDIAPRRAQAAVSASQSVDHAATSTREERAAAIQRPASVTRFAASDIAPQKATVKQQEAKEATPLGLAQLQSQLPTKPRPKAQAAQTETSQELKERLIQERLAETPNPRDDRFQEHQHKLNSFFSKQPKLLSAVAGALAVLVLVGYVTYLNLPGISMRIAASRAGFAATMPTYKPSGYSLQGPVAYEPGQIGLNFSSNTNEDKFTLTQKESSWDSQALLENFVAKQTENYLTYQEKGLTIYMYDGRAAWVNGGVWYNIEGNARLSSDQILKMATSM